MTCNPS
ncbi:hypothetical protein BDFB_004838 [Asbolus verrucosus]|nr:hypothetical protein BDFB_004838 [Asbolus verrucosus]